MNNQIVSEKNNGRPNLNFFDGFRLKLLLKKHQSFKNLSDRALELDEFIAARCRMLVIKEAKSRNIAITQSELEQISRQISIMAKTIFSSSTKLGSSDFASALSRLIAKKLPSNGVNLDKKIVQASAFSSQPANLG
ncbi:hypothetical protein COU37_03580 [Candidatus Micrarchaeota archaeon CG10_big_fil_rev_8_21_14_0_10_45_29]|nr:MAG: hypothetical protein COU37_03580 [Candidatus Micrarchaeota archaeon CG10_big_fil_rev_8_21_14_0_10_45_29]